MPTGVSTLSSGTSPSDAGRYVNDRLIQRSELHLRFASMADDRPLISLVIARQMGFPVGHLGAASCGALFSNTCSRR